MNLSFLFEQSLHTCHHFIQGTTLKTSKWKCMNKIFKFTLKSWQNPNFHHLKRSHRPKNVKIEQCFDIRKMSGGRIYDKGAFSHVLHTSKTVGFFLVWVRSNYKTVFPDTLCTNTVCNRIPGACLSCTSWNCIVKSFALWFS